MPGKRNWEDVVENIILESIRKGQLLTAGIVSIFIIIVSRLSPEDLGKLVLRILEAMESRCLLGYVLGILVITGWILHTRWLNSKYKKEIDRLSELRNNLQERLFGKIIQSSEVPDKDVTDSGDNKADVN